MTTDNMYGLPGEIKYCSRCNIINQKPTSTNEYDHDTNTKQIPIKFDENEVCYACKSVEKKWNNKIDWNEREKRAHRLIRKV